ncbi:hypothetical protein [Anaerococcus sp. HMSC065G05]|uniref:hypothetical protein n=1 Tax=Anaerococcus sp. HMSC065G05 TaxID=1739356 RepID=UPI0021BF0C1B|nr:hypothetical protein [Anaerococcus sp. HMSC065G05]
MQTKYGDAVIDKNEVKEYKQGDEIKAYIYFDKNNTLRASINLDIESGKIYSLKCIDVKKMEHIFYTKIK